MGPRENREQYYDGRGPSPRGAPFSSFPVAYSGSNGKSNTFF